MNNKIVMSGLSIVAALTLMGGAAYAAFVSQASSVGNTFSVGTADLLIATETAGQPTLPYGASITGFNDTGFYPGQSKNYMFWLKNTSTSGVVFNDSASFDTVVPTLGLDTVMQVQFSCVNTTTNVTSTSGLFTVAQWNGGTDAIGTLAPNQEARCTMTVTLPSSANNSVEGASVSFNGLFNATQAP